MEKRTYYVAVNTGEIVDDPTITPWQYEIHATEDEAHQLRELFDQASRQSMDVAYRVARPFSGSGEDYDMHHYDNTLQEIYRIIYRLGNEKAKEHIQSTNMIEEIGKEYR
ncbi:hydrolase [Pueribacillus theae]|uniref:Hydrolase n=1 Tax=Pueribacillus theae TaxID=2171751 RepID=A0A2U1JW32_9BACI|nr:hydrolase [Pueribacillus theae]PWA09033.1 hydrolase [Pueribacillus theae]